MKKWARYDQKFILAFMESTRYYCHILIKFEFSPHIFENYSDFLKPFSVGAELFHFLQTDRRTDRHDEANSRFSLFCERTQFNMKFCPTKLIFISQNYRFTTDVGLFHMSEKSYLISMQNNIKNWKCTPIHYFTCYWTSGSQDDWSGPGPWTCYEEVEVPSMDAASSCHSEDCNTLLLSAY